MNIKTIKQFITDHINEQPLHIKAQFTKINAYGEEELVSAIREYTQEAIRADRRHLLNHIKTVEVWGNLVEESVINAPQIELL